MPSFVGICGLLEIATGLMMLAAGQILPAALLVGFGILTLGLGAVIYELQLVRRQASAPGRDPKRSPLW